MASNCFCISSSCNSISDFSSTVISVLSCFSKTCCCSTSCSSAVTSSLCFSGQVSWICSSLWTWASGWLSPSCGWAAGSCWLSGCGSLAGSGTLTKASNSSWDGISYNWFGGSGVGVGVGVASDSWAFGVSPLVCVFGVLQLKILARLSVWCSKSGTDSRLHFWWNLLWFWFQFRPIGFF